MIFDRESANFFGKLGYVHDASDQWKDNFLEVLETLNGFVKSGKVRHIGLSNETAWGAMKFLGYSEAHNLERMQTIQNGTVNGNYAWSHEEFTFNHIFADTSVRAIPHVATYAGSGSDPWNDESMIDTMWDSLR